MPCAQIHPSAPFNFSSNSGLYSLKSLLRSQKGPNVDFASRNTFPNWFSCATLRLLIWILYTFHPMYRVKLCAQIQRLRGSWSRQYTHILLSNTFYCWHFVPLPFPLSCLTFEHGITKDDWTKLSGSSKLSTIPLVVLFVIVIKASNDDRTEDIISSF